MSLPLVASVDVGGTTVKGGVVDADGRVLHRCDRPTISVGPTDRAALVGGVVDHVRVVADEARRLGDLVAVGLAVPGVVDEHAGVGRYSMILGWEDVPFVDLLAPLGLPVAFGHDVSSGAYAEARLGAARGHTDWLFLALGTGLGSTFVLGERPYRGSNGTGGELAHVLVRPDGPVCRCGKRGCLEMVASGPAIADAYARSTGTAVSGAEEVAARAEAGDAAARAVWEDAVDALADVVATYAESMNPSLVVVGGGVGRAETLLVRRLGAELGPRVRFADPPPAVVPAHHGADAALLGVAARAHELARGGDRFGVPFFPPAPGGPPTRRPAPAAPASPPSSRTTTPRPTDDPGARR